MKYLLSLVVLVALAGVGCSQTTTSQTNVEATDEVPVAIEVTTQDGTVISNDGGETQITDSNGVPVMEVVLGEPANVTVEMEAANFSFTPNTITASPGDEIEITFTKNTGFHTFVIDELDLQFAIAQGESLIFTAPSEPGSYVFYCDIGSHRSMGMEGTLIVE